MYTLASAAAGKSTVLYPPTTADKSLLATHPGTTITTSFTVTIGDITGEGST